MDFNEKDVIWQRGVSGLTSEALSSYVAHVYAHSGRLDFKYHGEPMVLEGGSCMIMGMLGLITDLQPSEDFDAEVIYVTGTFLEMSTPRNNYGIRGTLMLFINPVMKLNEAEQRRCARNFEEVRMRLETDHAFKHDAVSGACQLLFLDFFSFHKRLYPGDDVPFQSADLMMRFLQLLMRGDYRQHREVSYYADILCVTPKYLSEVSKRVCGFGANYWINRFTIIELQRLLRRRDISITQIAEDFNFSSLPYFNRYVQNYLGVSPTAYRE